MIHVDSPESDFSRHLLALQSRSQSLQGSAWNLKLEKTSAACCSLVSHHSSLLSEATAQLSWRLPPSFASDRRTESLQQEPRSQRGEEDKQTSVAGIIGDGVPKKLEM